MEKNVKRQKKFLQKFSWMKNGFKLYDLPWCLQKCYSYFPELKTSPATLPLGGKSPHVGCWADIAGLRLLQFCKFPDGLRETILSFQNLEKEDTSWGLQSSKTGTPARTKLFLLARELCVQSWYSQSWKVQGLDHGLSQVLKVQGLDPGFLPSSMVFIDIRQKSRDFSFGAFFHAICLVLKIHTRVWIIE